MQTTKRQRYKRSETTRQALITAAIRCLAKHGYTGTTLGHVADEAGLSRGPRQYYFPTRVDLIIAVWEYNTLQTKENFHAMLADCQGLEEKIDAAVDYTFDSCGTPAHLANLEIKLALRSDSELEMALSDRLAAAEKQADERWVQTFRASRLSKRKLLSMRDLLLAVIRGLAIEMIARPTEVQATSTFLREQTRQILKANILP